MLKKLKAFLSNINFLYNLLDNDLTKDLETEGNVKYWIKPVPLPPIFQRLLFNFEIPALNEVNNTVDDINSDAK